MSMQLKKIIPYVVAGWIPGGQRWCVLCGKRIWRFMPYKRGVSSAPKLTEALGIVGSDTENFECPRCGCSDRERHLFLYMQKAGLLASLVDKSILHFAPERRLAGKILDMKPARYVRCDLHPADEEVMQVDIQTMPFEDESFDLVMANHVLEHVMDDIAALAEIRRVLKGGGLAILQTPFASKLHSTWQDAGVDTNEARQLAFGQADHVRLFGRDIFSRLEASGLTSCISWHGELLEDLDAAVHGVNVKEPFFLFRRANEGESDS